MQDLVMRLKKRRVCTENSIRVDDVTESPELAEYRASVFRPGRLGSPFKSNRRLEAENAVPQQVRLLCQRHIDHQALADQGGDGSVEGVVVSALTVDLALIK